MGGTRLKRGRQEGRRHPIKIDSYGGHLSLYLFPFTPPRLLSPSSCPFKMNHFVHVDNFVIHAYNEPTNKAGPSFASSAVGSLHASKPSGEGRTTGVLDGAGPPWLSSAVFRLLTSVMRVRNASTRALVPQACELALGRLHALG